jgi:hypothetical protein
MMRYRIKQVNDDQFYIERRWPWWPFWTTVQVQEEPAQDDMVGRTTYSDLRFSTITAALVWLRAHHSPDPLPAKITYHPVTEAMLTNPAYDPDASVFAAHNAFGALRGNR